MIAELMVRFIEIATSWLWLVLLASWRALPILILVIGIGLAFRRKLTRSLHAMLLTIVVVRLLIPISIGSPLSLHKPIDNWFFSDAEESVNRDLPMTAHGQNVTFLPNVDQNVIRDAPSEFQSQSSQPLDFTFAEILYAVLVLSVISVSLGLLFRSVFSHVRFALVLRSCRLLDNQPLIDLVLRECDSLGVGRRPVLREVSSLAAPAVFGLVRKTICLPTGLTETLNEQELRWVIRHELAHIRRHDIPVVIIASIAEAFHWFNPLVWLIVSHLRAAMEAAADRLALQSLSQNEICAYGDLLLRIAQDSVAAKKSPTLGMISFASGKHLKKRVELLMREGKPNGLSTQFFSAGLVAAIALVGLTDARDVKEHQMPEVNLVAIDSTKLPVQPLWFGPVNFQEIGGPTFINTYDLSSILKSVPNWLKADEKTPLEQLTSFIPLPPWMKEKLHVDGETLSAELTANQHQMLKQTLDVWKDGEPNQIAVEGRFIRTDIKTASSIDWTA